MASVGNLGMRPDSQFDSVAHSCRCGHGRWDSRLPGHCGPSNPAMKFLRLSVILFAEIVKFSWAFQKGQHYSICKCGVKGRILELYSIVAHRAELQLFPLRGGAGDDEAVL